MPNTRSTIIKSPGTYLLSVFVLLILTLSPVEKSFALNDISKAERSLLPQWCKFTQTFVTGAQGNLRYQQYLGQYGEGWKHVHHFCWGLVSMVRAAGYDTSASQRDYFLKSAIMDFDYVLERAPENFVLRFDINLKKVRALLTRNELNNAESLARQIVERWSDRADAYGLLAEVYLAAKAPHEARKALEQGVDQVKDKDRLDQIRSVLAPSL